MKNFLLRRLSSVAALLGVLAGGAVAGWVGAKYEQEEIFTHLIDHAKLSAVAFDAAEIRQLSGTRADVGTPTYAAVKSRLRSLRAVDSRVRFVYIFRSVPGTKKVIYLADSATPGAKDESLPGDDYPQAGESPGLQQVLTSGAAASEGPLRDDFGVWNTGYALIDERSTPNGGTIKEILGVDTDATNWQRDQWLARLKYAVAFWLLAGVPVLAWRSSRRTGEQREIIRNLSEAMEQSYSALMICDLENRIEYANRGLCQQIGYSRRELIGRSWREFRVSESTDEVMGEILATVRSGQAWSGEWFNRRKDGTVYPVRGVITPVKRSDGSLSCLVAVFDDVTEVKRREAELREARDLAEAGDRAKSQFLATMSHEVRTPLNGIVGFTSLLLDTELAPDQREFVQTIRTSSEALIQLTGDILDFARIESGKLKLDEGPCDPRNCVEDVLDLVAARAAEKNIELLYRVAADVPASVHTDAGRLRQILSNLIGNAVKFTERGEVTVSLTVSQPHSRAPFAVPNPHVPADAAEVILGFSVQDTGIGIASGEKTKLFKPFSQLDDSSTRRYGGTGLGLAISRNLVRLLGGEIGFVSEPGRGSVFTFTISTRVLTPNQSIRDLSHARVGVSAPPGPFRRELGALLSSWGAAVSEADSVTGLPFAKCDLFLVDVNESLAREWSARTEPLPGLKPENAFGLVPISLPSELRNGLRTHFRLLLNKPLHHEVLYSNLAGNNASAAPAPASPSQLGLRVLIVEDNVVNQRLIRRVLTSLGCTFNVAENGRVALEELSRHAADYDLVLLDFHMPEMDGITALQEIRAGRAGPVARQMWIIALTADARDEQREKAEVAGLDDYLTKPLRVTELEAAFQRFRAARRGQKA